MSSWIEILEAEAQAKWDSGKPLLGSQIPPILQSHGVDLSKALAGRPLLTALRFDAAETLGLVQHPLHAAVWAIVPRSVADSTDPQSIFSVKKAAVTPEVKPPQNIQKFKPWFWSAFVKLLEPGKRRWLFDGRFIDIEVTEPKPSQSAIEILATDIANPGAGVRADPMAVLNAIKTWASRHDLSIVQYEASDDDIYGVLRTQRTHLAFESLEIDDLKRIVIPLDIVMKLLRKK